MLEALYDLVILPRTTARSCRMVQKNGAFVVALGTCVVCVHAVTKPCSETFFYN